MSRGVTGSAVYKPRSKKHLSSHITAAKSLHEAAHLTSSKGIGPLCVSLLPALTVLRASSRQGAGKSRREARPRPCPPAAPLCGRGAGPRALLTHTRRRPSPLPGRPRRHFQAPRRPLPRWKPASDPPTHTTSSGAAARSRLGDRSATGRLPAAQQAIIEASGPAQPRRPEPREDEAELGRPRSPQRRATTSVPSEQ